MLIFKLTEQTHFEVVQDTSFFVVAKEASICNPVPFCEAPENQQQRKTIFHLPYKFLCICIARILCYNPS